MQRNFNLLIGGDLVVLNLIYSYLWAPPPLSKIFVFTFFERKVLLKVWGSYHPQVPLEASRGTSDGILYCNRMSVWHYFFFSYNLQTLYFKLNQQLTLSNPYKLNHQDNGRATKGQYICNATNDVQVIPKCQSRVESSSPAGLSTRTGFPKQKTAHNVPK